MSPAKKKSPDAPKVVRETLIKGLKVKFPDLFKRPSGGPRISAAALAMLSPTLRASVMAELKKGQEGATYSAVDIGEYVLSFSGLPCNK